MLTITNTQKGPRGVNTVAGPALVEPGETVELKVYEREKEHLRASGWFEFKGSFEPNPAVAAASPSAAPASTDDKNAASIARLTEQVSALTAALSAAMQRGAPSETPAASSALVAKHAGGGAWFVYDGEEKVSESMSKEDAEAFNKLSDDEKAALVKKG